MLYDLIRYDAGSHTPGILTVEGVQFKLEGLPWKNNHRGTSCIEDGTYTFFKDYSNNKKRKVVEFMPHNNRSQIQLHVGQLKDLKGCFGHESKQQEKNCFNLLPDVGQIRVTTIHKKLIQE